MPDKQSDNFDYSGRETLTDLTKANNYNNHLVQKIQAHYEIGATVLDFGAGNGHFLSLLKSKPARFLALEPDQKLQVEIKSKSVAEVLSPHELKQCSVNFIYTLNVLEHIEQDTETLKVFHGWLEKGGVLIVYVPAIPHLYSKFDASIGHFRRYKKTELEKKLKLAGFDVLEIKFMDPLGYLLALVYKLFLNSGKVNNSQIALFDRFVYPLSRIIATLTENLFGKNLLAIAVKNS